MKLLSLHPNYPCFDKYKSHQHEISIITYLLQVRSFNQHFVFFLWKIILSDFCLTCIFHSHQYNLSSCLANMSSLHWPEFFVHLCGFPNHALFLSLSASYRVVTKTNNLVADVISLAWSLTILLNIFVHPLTASILKSFIYNSLLIFGLCWQLNILLQGQTAISFNEPSLYAFLWSIFNLLDSVFMYAEKLSQWIL